MGETRLYATQRPDYEDEGNFEARGRAEGVLGKGTGRTSKNDTLQKIGSRHSGLVQQHDWRLRRCCQDPLSV